MPLVLPAGERIRRKSDCFRRLAVGERLPQRLRYRPEVNAVEKQLLLPDALPLGKGRYPRCRWYCLPGNAFAESAAASEGLPLGKAPSNTCDTAQK